VARTVQRAPAALLYCFSRLRAARISFHLISCGLMRATFIGGGNMAGALIGGLLKQGWSAGDISVVEILPAAREALARRFGVAVHAALAERLEPEETIVLAVKPQQMRAAALELQPWLGSQLVVSIAAGIRTRDLSRWLGKYERIVRVMPNTPALVSAGVSALYAMPAVDRAGREAAEHILSAVGAALWVEREELMDAVTAVSGSGPAYVFYFMEAVMQAAEALGLSPDQARRLTLETFYGAACLARHSVEAPAALRARVTSKGGTTERALEAMDDAGVKRQLIDAVLRAAQRSRELGDEFGGV
jgi:pyrroline-5-carboxylate reductase